MLLADREIEALRTSGDLGIDPFDRANLTPNGYDLSIKEVLVRGTDAPVTSGSATVPSKHGFLLSTREVVRLPSDVAAQLWIRSSFARRGVLASFGKVEAGFDGELTLAAFNADEEPIELTIGDRFAQIVFERLGASAAEVYAQRSGNYQGQRGVTLERENAK